MHQMLQRKQTAPNQTGRAEQGSLFSELFPTCSKRSASRCRRRRREWTGGPRNIRVILPERNITIILYLVAVSWPFG
ncbi:hypothetical protein BCV70DRAFT_70618 [Testicularia cyperi]|uniref:Uncharacterized protein n=1 Tax=Testicularia cyperi TaxID=1882483 RepID=A0A317XFJ0_9BASI|nr:hypothetical protein BCV70DRAFT_70618 [Testicularia cyperi]